MARLTIPDEQTFAEFSVVTSTTAFPITFSLFAKADLTVIVGTTTLGQSEFTFTGTVLDGGGYDGGTVTLNTAVTSGTVRIERNVAPVRTSNFAPSASIPVGSVDQALNRLTAVQQDLKRREKTNRDYLDAAIAEAGTGIGFAGKADIDGSNITAPGTFRTAIGADLSTNVNFSSRTVSAKLTDSLATADRGVLTTGSAAVNTAAINTLIDEVHAATGFLEVSEGTYDVTQVVLPPAGDFRDEPFTFRGRGTGEPYVIDGLQGGTLLNGTSATLATVKVNRAGAVMGAGSIEFGDIRVSGTQNANVPALQIDGLLGLNHFHDFTVNQKGVGDGIQLGWFGGSVMDRFVVLGPTWAVAGGVRTGTGVTWEPDYDIGLGELSHGTARGFLQGWQIGQAAPGANPQRLLAHKMSMCEVSYCTDGILINPQVEGFHVDQPYIEGATGTGIHVKGRATLITAPYIVLDFTKGIDLQASGGVVTGGVLGLATTGSKGIVIGAGGSGARSVFGTQLVWGGGSVGTNVGYGIFIEPQSNPRVNLFPDFAGDWLGVSGSAQMVDQSYSSEHGGAASAMGSGAIGYLERRTQADEPLPCLSRGAINLRVDGGALTEPYINVSGTLTLSNASVQRLTLSGPTTAIGRFVGPNLPDKTGVLLIDNGYAQFNPGFYLKGISAPLIFAAGEVGAIWYQVLPGPNGIVQITSVLRDKVQQYTVATLPSAATVGAGYRAFVTDAAAPTFGATVAGGGAVATPVYSDSAAWRVG